MLPAWAVWRSQSGISILRVIRASEGLLGANIGGNASGRPCIGRGLRSHLLDWSRGPLQITLCVQSGIPSSDYSGLQVSWEGDRIQELEAVSPVIRVSRSLSPLYFRGLGCICPRWVLRSSLVLTKLSASPFCRAEVLLPFTCPTVPSIILPGEDRPRYCFSVYSACSNDGSRTELVIGFLPFFSILGGLGG